MDRDEARYEMNEQREERASWLVLQIALDGFRRLYGTKARPEDVPVLWANIVAQVRQDLEDAEEI